MKKKALSGLLMFIIALFTLAGCNTGNDITHQQPTTATLAIISQGTLTTGTQIGAVDVTVNLPSGVTVQATPDSVNTAVLVMNTGVVVASGVTATVNTYLTGAYTAATAADPGKIVIRLVNANGVGTGEFVTVHCDIAAGVFPVAADFNLTDFKAWDTNGVEIIPRLTAGFTADIR